MISYSLPDQRGYRKEQGFSAIEISLPTAALNVAEILLTSRYPATDLALNTKSEMVVRILEGETDFTCEGETVRLPKGSTVLVQANRPYYWQPNGSVTLYVVSSPPWTSDQHRTISS